MGPPEGLGLGNCWGGCGVRDPDTVGTVCWAAVLDDILGGGGRAGALGGTVIPALLLLQFSLGGSSLSMNLVAALALLNLSHSVRTVWGAGLGRLRSTRLTGRTLLDFLLRQKVAVEMRTVMATTMAMTPANTPTAFIGLSLVCIRKAAMEPRDSVWKKKPHPVSTASSSSLEDSDRVSFPKPDRFKHPVPRRPFKNFRQNKLRQTTIVSCRLQTPGVFP